MEVRKLQTVRQRITGCFEKNVGTVLLGMIVGMKPTKSENGDRKGESGINAAEKEGIMMKAKPMLRTTETKYTMPACLTGTEEL
jgi:hypothetical protein